MCSQRDYEAIAVILDQALAEYGELTMLDEIADKLATHFKRTNARFDRGRFLEACGLIAGRR